MAPPQHRFNCNSWHIVRATAGQHYQQMQHAKASGFKWAMHTMVTSPFVQQFGISLRAPSANESKLHSFQLHTTQRYSHKHPVKIKDCHTSTRHLPTVPANSWLQSSYSASELLQSVWDIEHSVNTQMGLEQQSSTACNISSIMQSASTLVPQRIQIQHPRSQQSALQLCTAVL